MDHSWKAFSDTKTVINYVRYGSSKESRKVCDAVEGTIPRTG